MAKGKVVLIRAIVERATPDRVQYKPYATELTFGGNLEIELEVPADQVVEQKGGKIVVTAAGYASMLKDYVVQIERMNEQINREAFQPNTRKY